MELNELQQARLEKLERLRAAGIDPYPPRSTRTHTARQVLDAFETLAATQQPVAIAGRMLLRRVFGGSTFAHLADESGRIQIFLSKKDLDAAQYKLFVDATDLGDIIGVQGYAFRTKTGEPSIFVQQWQMLAKALNPLPEKHAGLTDYETRLRQRYLDLIVNEDVRETFRKRARLIGTLRQFMDERGFIEVETPILQPIYGGAAARPFVTHHNQLHQDLYLRIAPELYLKRLIVGGFERVYEIGKAFRNEGVDRFHNPEFTIFECYQAYADYHAMMELTEQLVLRLARELVGSTQVTFAGHTVDVTPPWPRIPMRQAIQERTGIDIVAANTLEALRAAIRERGLQVDPQPTWAKLVDELLKTYVRPTLIAPCFIIDYPQPLSPLAKRKPDDPAFVERFQPFIFGSEIGNAFTELNDPLDQEQRFIEQGRAAAAGDDEAMQMDLDFLNALMTGMPPTGGLGLGIDRLTMIFTGRETIREVILFPHLRRVEET
ncbi:lysine--tRNA ligase [Kallotenue papyrolyticum]|uniref:lysine--tRNA ligase n=1 Tax=Kallotenue papyrolyticum TaxID=1325125 RepID=UPI000478654D|nr:lysine--tRNA ligase [Kallotenue papyrolyticum]